MEKRSERPMRAMFSSTPPVHGGQLDAIARQLSIPEEELLDLSANIHPEPPSPEILAAIARLFTNGRTLGVYPESTYRALRGAVGSYVGVDPACISVANGAMPLLQAALTVFGVRSCLTAVPAFEEYRRMTGAAYRPFVLRAENGFLPDAAAVLAELDRGGCDAMLLANPHSPSGALLPRAAMEDLAEKMSARGKLLIVDEAFIDWTPEHSVSQLATRFRMLVVLRSLTKFFAIPGARVGYAVVHPDSKAALDGHVPLWPVDTFAGELARLQLGGNVEARRESTARERAWLKERLEGLGLTVFNGSANFLLFRCETPGSLWRNLIVNHRVLVRACETFEGLDGRYFRTAVRTRAESERLLRALSAEVP